MRRILITVLLVAMARLLPAAVLPADNDTIRTFENVKNVSVVGIGSATRISVVVNDSIDDYVLDIVPGENDDTGWNLKLPFLKPRNASRRHYPSSSYYGFRQFYVGSVVPVGACDAFRSSWEIGIAELGGATLRTSLRGPELSIGFGLGYRQIAVGKGSMIYSDATGHIALRSVPDGSDKVKSRIRTFNVMFPLTIRQSLSCRHKFGLLLSAVANLNTYTKAFSNYKVDGVKCSETFKGLHQKMLTLELTAGLGWLDEIGVYVKYAPCHMFAQGYGPGFRTLSAGVVLGF